MFVPYFLFSNVKFNGTVLPFEYLEILGFRYKGIPKTFGPFSTRKFWLLVLRGTPHLHMLTQKDPRQINHPGPILIKYS